MPSGDSPEQTRMSTRIVWQFDWVIIEPRDKAIAGEPDHTSAMIEDLSRDSLEHGVHPPLEFITRPACAKLGNQPGGQGGKASNIDQQTSAMRNRREALPKQHRPESVSRKIWAKQMQEFFGRHYAIYRQSAECT
jgi:hypothetical protein